MSAPVPVRHPVPATVRSRRGSRPVAAYAAHAGQAVLREAAPSSFRPLGFDATPGGFTPDEARRHPCFEREGLAWIPLGRRYGPCGEVVPMGRAEFLDWLASPRPVTDDAADGMSVLAGTPLLAWSPEAAPTRGDPDAADGVAEADALRGAGDLARFFGDRILMRAGTPMLRLALPAVGLVRNRFGKESIAEGHAVPSCPMVARPDRLDGLVAALGLDYGVLDPVAWPDFGQLPDLPGSAAGDDDLLHFANFMPGELLRFASGPLRRLRAPGARFLAPFRALERWDRLGAIGAVRPDEVDGAARDILAAVAAMRAAFPNKGRAPWLDRVEGYAARYVPTILRRQPVPDEDIDALGPLAADAA